MLRALLRSALEVVGYGLPTRAKVRLRRGA